MAVRSAPFTFANAFTSDVFGGNPAATVFLDTSKEPLEVLQGISKNFNQPMTTFVTPLSRQLRLGETVVAADVRFVTVTGVEVPICGHGSLAAAKALLGLPREASLEIKEIRFNTIKGVVITIKVLPTGFLEMELPAAVLEPLPVDEHQRIVDIMNEAFGRELKINNVVRGAGNFSHGAFWCLDSKEAQTPQLTLR